MFVSAKKLGHVLAAMMRINVIAMNLLCDAGAIQKRALLSELTALVAITTSKERANVYALYMTALTSGKEIDPISMH